MPCTYLSGFYPQILEPFSIRSFRRYYLSAIDTTSVTPCSHKTVVTGRVVLDVSNAPQMVSSLLHRNLAGTMSVPSGTRLNEGTHVNDVRGKGEKRLLHLFNGEQEARERNV